MAKKSDSKTTTTFEKMGESIIGHVVNASGARSKYTMPVKKKDSKGGSSAGFGTKANRKGKLERMGASLHPTATLCKQNAAAASDVQKNTIKVSSAVGNRDFYDKRNQGKGIK